MKFCSLVLENTFMVHSSNTKICYKPTSV